jgi:hypothetical protein
MSLATARSALMGREGDAGMAGNPNPPADRPRAEGVDDVIAELRARVDQLEADLSRKDRELSSVRRGRRPEERELTETTRETTNRTIDEVNKLFRSLTLGYLEGLRTAADAVGTFADEVARRSPAEAEDMAKDLPGDIYAGYLKAVNQALKIPERSVDKFQETYKQEGPSERSR